MADASELNEIKEELHTLRLLYKNIAEQHILTEEPCREDLESVEETIDLDGILAHFDKKRAE